MRVLIVDDDQQWIDEVRSILARLGHETAANIGARGAMAAAHIMKPNVILLDLNMPDLNGNWLIPEFKQTGARIYFCSSAEPSSLRRIARLANVNGAITKTEVRAASTDLLAILEGKS